MSFYSHAEMKTFTITPLFVQRRYYALQTAKYRNYSQDILYYEFPQSEIAKKGMWGHVTLNCVGKEFLEFHAQGFVS